MELRAEKKIIFAETDIADVTDDVIASEKESGVGVLLPTLFTDGISEAEK